MGATSRAGRPARVARPRFGRGQPSDGGAGPIAGFVGASGADGTGTVIHDGCADLERDPTVAGTRRPATPPECTSVHRTGQRTPMVLPVTGTYGGSARRGPGATIVSCARDLDSTTLGQHPSGHRPAHPRPTARAPRPPDRSSGGSSARTAR